MFCSSVITSIERRNLSWRTLRRFVCEKYCRALSHLILEEALKSLSITSTMFDCFITASFLLCSIYSNIVYIASKSKSRCDKWSLNPCVASLVKTEKSGSAVKAYMIGFTQTEGIFDSVASLPISACNKQRFFDSCNCYP